MQDWRAIAHTLLANAKEATKSNKPTPTLSLFSWDKRTYFGQVQAIYPNVYPDILLVSKTSYPIGEDLAKEILLEEAETLVLLVDKAIDFEGNYHVLRLHENVLSAMTPDQTKYVIENPFALADQNQGAIDGKLIDYNKK
jgi:hypothetical protein